MILTDSFLEKQILKETQKKIQCHQENNACESLYQVLPVRAGNQVYELHFPGVHEFFFHVKTQKLFLPFFLTCKKGEGNKAFSLSC